MTVLPSIAMLLLAASKPIFSYTDYPPEAVFNHWEGTVVADLTISAKGKPTACRIVKSSGHEVLDSATCDLILKRARFKPAEDEHGAPRESTYRTPPINWKLNP
jgi:protein TonB